MRRFGLASLVLLLSAGPARAAGDRLGTGESLTVTVTPRPRAVVSTPGAPSTSEGMPEGFRVVAAPAAIRDAIDFLTAWGHRRADLAQRAAPGLTVPLGDPAPSLAAVTLQLPIRHLQVLRAPDGGLLVQVGEAHLVGPDGPVTLGLRLALEATSPDHYRVRAITRMP